MLRLSLPLCQPWQDVPGLRSSLLLLALYFTVCDRHSSLHHITPAHREGCGSGQAMEMEIEEGLKCPVLKSGEGGKEVKGSCWMIIRSGENSGRLCVTAGTKEQVDSWNTVIAQDRYHSNYEQLNSGNQFIHLWIRPCRLLKQRNLHQMTSLCIYSALNLHMFPFPLDCRPQLVSQTPTLTP